MLISIDTTKDTIEAVKTCEGLPEERQVLRPGPKGMGTCIWACGTAYESEVPNLTIASRAAAKCESKQRKDKLQKKPAAKPAMKKAKAKPKPSPDEELDEESDESEEEAPKSDSSDAGEAADTSTDPVVKKQPAKQACRGALH